MEFPNPSPLDHRRLSRALSGSPIGHHVVYHPSLASTNDQAHALGTQGHPHGTVVIADTQTAGRGRRGASWESPPGLNLYLSVILKPDGLPVENWPRLTTTIALAICRAIETHAPVQAQVKWPNDIYLADKKIAGILTETGQTDANGQRYIVAGAGINVLGQKTDFPPELRDTATSLAIETPENPPTREAIATSFLQELARLLPLTGPSFPDILADVTRRSWLLHRDVTWTAADGAQSHGHATGLDPQGHLLVRLPDGTTQTLASVEKIRRSN